MTGCKFKSDKKAADVPVFDDVNRLFLMLILGMKCYCDISSRLLVDAIMMLNLAQMVHPQAGQVARGSLVSITLKTLTFNSVTTRGIAGLRVSSQTLESKYQDGIRALIIWV